MLSDVLLSRMLMRCFVVDQRMTEMIRTTVTRARSMRDYLPPCSTVRQMLDFPQHDLVYPLTIITIVRLFLTSGTRLARRRR